VVTNHEHPSYDSSQFMSRFKSWLEDILDQKQYVAQLQEELEVLREAVRDKKEELRAAEHRLFVLLEEVGQQRLPFHGCFPATELPEEKNTQFPPDISGLEDSSSDAIYDSPGT